MNRTPYIFWNANPCAGVKLDHYPKNVGLANPTR
jgi:hypothetical protein